MIKRIMHILALKTDSHIVCVYHRRANSDTKPEQNIMESLSVVYIADRLPQKNKWLTDKKKIQKG